MERPGDDQTNRGLERVHHELRADGIKADARTPLRSGIHSRGYLPHVKREGASYFVTFRLADALPKEVLLKFEAEKAQRLRRLDLMIKRGEKSNVTLIAGTELVISDAPI